MCFVNFHDFEIDKPLKNSRMRFHDYRFWNTDLLLKSDIYLERLAAKLEIVIFMCRARK